MICCNGKEIAAHKRVLGVCWGMTESAFPSVICKQPHGVSDVCPANPLRTKSDSRKDEPREVFIRDAEPSSLHCGQQDRILHGP